MADTGVSIEELYDKTKSIYKLVVLASRRAIELNGGAAQLTEAEAGRISHIALQEIVEGRVSYKSKPAKK